MNSDADQPVTEKPAENTGGLFVLIRHLISHDAHPIVQFLKYGFAGGIATLTFSAVFAWLTATHFPVEGDSKFNYTIASLIAFFPSNIVAYIMNILWVFKPGRHSRLVEVMMFLAASAFAFVIGTLIGQVMVNKFDLVGPLRFAALGISIVASVMVNYACRKFIIFKG